jgi:hypothetical protein
MKKSIIGWAIWLLGIVLIFAADYALRVLNNDMYAGGIPVEIQVALSVVIALPALWFFYLGVKERKAWVKIVAVGAQAYVGFWVYAFLGLYYVCTAGIDCL